MTENQQEKKILQQADELFDSPFINDARLLKIGRIEKPIRVLTPSGLAHSWFVPVVAADKMAGFFQFTHDGELMRFSSFSSREGDFAPCSPAENWLNKDNIMMTAKKVAQDDETLESPFLSYYNSPERIVWIVKACSSSGKCRTIMVTGELAYIGQDHAGLGD